MVYDECKIEKRCGYLVKRLAFLLYAHFPFSDNGVPSQPSAHLRRDLGLLPEDMLLHWRDLR